MNTYLSHHGVPGMHWGVRRYQNYDGTLTPLGKEHYNVGKFGDRRTPEQLVRKTIPSGSTFYRIQRKGVTSLGNQNGGIYVYGKLDQHNIRSITPWFADTQKRDSVEDFEEIKLKTNKPIKVASQKDTDDAIRELLNRDKQAAYKIMDVDGLTAALNVNIDINKLRSGKSTIREVSDIIRDQLQQRMRKNNIVKRFFSEDAAKQYNMDKFYSDNARMYAQDLLLGVRDAEAMLKHFGKTDISDKRTQRAIERGKDFMTQRIADNSYIQKQVYEILRSKGFNAMYDNNMINAGIMNRPFEEAHEPLILLDNTSIERTGENRGMTQDDVNRSIKKAMKYINMQKS